MWSFEVRINLSRYIFTPSCEQLSSQETVSPPEDSGCSFPRGGLPQPGSTHVPTTPIAHILVFIYHAFLVWPLKIYLRPFLGPRQSPRQWRKLKTTPSVLQLRGCRRLCTHLFWPLAQFFLHARDIMKNLFGFSLP